jgi:membrane protein DedA with SNARE-associated domain
MIDNFAFFLERAASTFHALIEWLVEVVGALGYPGIIALMFLESSFFPFPSEVVIPPAGYLASKGQMNLFLVVACGIIGSILGAVFNYYIAVKWGRKFFDRFGKYFFVSPEALDKAEAFFEKHGHISTFTARLLPVIRQYVSLPAGLARMNMFKFCLYTALGSGIWVVILAAVGYWVGAGGDDVQAVLNRVTAALVIFCAVLITLYVAKHRRKRGV